MSKRGWYAGLAIGLAVLAAIAAGSLYLHHYYHNEYRTSERAAVEAEHSQDDAADSAHALFWRWYAGFYREDESGQQSRSEDRAEQDLIAQREMAEWSFWLLLVSVFGMLVSVSGLTALFYSLYQTRTAIQDNREIGEAQTRAYLVVKPSVFITKPKKIAKLALRNTGQSPAKKVRHLSAVGPLPWPLIASQGDLLTPHPDDATPEEIIGAASEVTIEADWADSEVRGPICVYGVVLYEDVFGSVYKLRYCARNDRTQERAERGVIEKNDWEFSHFHNDETKIGDRR